LFQTEVHFFDDRYREAQRGAVAPFANNRLHDLPPSRACLQCRHIKTRSQV
jgi:hypothetical protein